MAYIRDPKLIFDKMKQDGIAFWTVFDSDKKTIIDEVDSEEADAQESLDKLQDLIYSLDGLIYIVLRTTNKRVRAAGGDVKGTYQYSLRLGNSASSISGVGERGGHGSSGMLKDMLQLMEQRHQAEMKALEARLTLHHQMEDLKRQIKEKNTPDATDKLLEQVFTMFAAQNAGAMKPPIALAGNDENPQASEQQLRREEAKVMLTQAIQRLYKVDPNFHEALNKLADMAENNPGKYQMALSML